MFGEADVSIGELMLLSPSRLLTTSRDTVASERQCHTEVRKAEQAHDQDSPDPKKLTKPVPCSTGNSGETCNESNPHGEMSSDENAEFSHHDFLSSIDENSDVDVESEVPELEYEE